ncbi:hypothetical protein MNBD_GAMMA23-123 [hydrothermal vent metagenome]|uniref:Type II secretion system protein L n=1 Tax=hydrothermal vent metagenome TaxID=652676 RepID=A0A3B0ZWN9_9ZZZZ
MARELFIFLDSTRQNNARLDNGLEPAPAHGRWVLCNNGKPLGTLIKGPLSSAAKAARDARVIVIVPGEDVVISEISLPGQNKQRLLDALPFALEDQLIDDVSDLHFVLGPRYGNSQYVAAVVNRECMQRWNDICDELGLRVDVMVPDTLALSTSIGTWTILLEDTRSIVRTGVHAGFAVDHSNLNQLLSTTITDAEGVTPERINIIDCRDVNINTNDFSLDSGIELHVNNFENDSLIWLAGHFDYEAPVNLLFGEFSRKEKVKGQLRKWYPAAMLLAAVLFLSVTTKVVNYISLSNESRRLTTEMERVYKRTFPQAKRVVNAPAQMQQKFKAFQSRTGKSQSSLSSMLTLIAPILRSTPGLTIKSLRYQNGRIDIESDLRNFAALNQLEKVLSERAGMKVEVKSASQNKDKVVSRLEIRRQGS